MSPWKKDLYDPEILSAGLLNCFYSNENLDRDIKMPFIFFVLYQRNVLQMEILDWLGNLIVGQWTCKLSNSPQRILEKVNPLATAKDSYTHYLKGSEAATRGLL